jgi:hypothetical protein
MGLPQGGSLKGQAVDAGGALVTSFGLREAASVIPGVKRFAGDLGFGGGILAIGKLAAIPFRGFQVDGRLPDILTSRLPGAAAPAAALPGGAPAGVPMVLATSSAGMGF